MAQTSYRGIDYSMGHSNVNRETGIHYGVISQHSILSEAAEDFEQFYGDPTCPKCGGRAIDVTDEHEEFEQHSSWGCADYACESCKITLDSSEVFSDESLGFTYDKDGYKLADCLDSDIFVLLSPFYTFAQFCSPCVPGAGNLESFCEDGIKTYCLGHDWFEDGKAPYPVYRVSDDSIVTSAS